MAARMPGRSDPRPRNWRNQGDRPWTQRTRTPVRPSARRSSGSNNVQALDLSQLTRLPPLARPSAASAEAKSETAAGATSARSDAGSHVSFGSEHSAFTCWSTSSPSSSQLASPRPIPLKTTVSMPALTPR